MENTHYHLNGVCREHGAAPLFVYETEEELLEAFATKLNGTLEDKYPEVIYRDQTPRYFEADVVDKNGNAHSLFFAYGTHTAEFTASECREQMEAMRAMEDMIRMMEQLSRGERPEANPFSAPDETLPPADDALFQQLDDFFRNEQQGG